MFILTINDKDMVMTQLRSNFEKTNKFDSHVEDTMGLDRKVRLTRREAEVLEYVIQGLSAKGIARKINISHRTVEKYIESLKAKYNCATKSILIYKCIRTDETY
jgi:DNA-binding NarL/FixJ family response regulator